MLPELVRKAVPSSGCQVSSTAWASGEGASPALYGNTVVVNWDDETDNDFIVALDKRDGKQLWKNPRDEDTTWSTPLIVEHGGKAQVIVNATSKVRSYDLATGRELWSCAGQTVNVIPSPVADAETVYVMSGFRGSAVFAIALGRTGDLTGTQATAYLALVPFERGTNNPQNTDPTSTVGPRCAWAPSGSSASR